MMSLISSGRDHHHELDVRELLFLWAQKDVCFPYFHLHIQATGLLSYSRGPLGKCNNYIQRSPKPITRNTTVAFNSWWRAGFGVYSVIPSARESIRQELWKFSVYYSPFCRRETVPLWESWTHTCPWTCEHINHPIPPNQSANQANKSIKLKKLVWKSGEIGKCTILCS